jgi:Alkyl hydroperoxide reductase, large subunit
MNTTDVFDVAIAGYGPTGITAGIYIARRMLSAVLFGDTPGGEVVNSGEIENWPGDRTTDGIALSEKFVSHLNDHKDMVTIVPRNVRKVSKTDNIFSLELEDGTTYRAKSVIYATGRKPRLLNVPGEAEYKNKGVSYCATCDAPLFANKNVAVIGGGDSGAEAVVMLQRIAKKVYLLHLGDALKAEPILVDNFIKSPNVTIITKAKTLEISGNQLVSGLTYEDLTTGEKKTLEVEGVFVAIGAVPNTEPVKGFVELDELGAIVADPYGKTNVEGFFAAGDVTNARDAQIVIATGQGSSAALSVANYLSRTRV